MIYKYYTHNLLILTLQISVTAKQEREPNNVAWYHGLFFGNKKHTFDIVVKAKAPLTRTYRVQVI